METKQEIFEHFNTSPAFHLATVEDGKPHVRGMLLFKADERGVIFHTGKFKDVFRQIQANPNVEICFSSPKTERSTVCPASWCWMRIKPCLKRYIITRRVNLCAIGERS